MKIDNIDNTTKSIAGGAIREESPRPTKQASDDPGTSAQSALVQLSALSAQLQTIQRSFADTPVVDAARVAALKEAISSGYFKVDADKIADRLLETVQSLIASRKP